jgi:PAS domain S-box-containing protein
MEEQMNKERILVVDDEPSILRLMNIILSSEGYDVDTASDGIQAIEKAGGCDVVFLDIFMPGMNGLEALRRIREIPHPPEVVMMTGITDQGSLRTAFIEGGAFDYLIKPLKAQEVISVAQEAIFKRNISSYRHEIRDILDKGLERLESGYEQRTRKLRESQLNYRMLMENLPEGLLVVQGGTVRFANKRAQIWRGEGEEIAGRPFSDLVQEDGGRLMEEMERDPLQGGGTRDPFTFRFLRSTGVSFWAEATLVPIEWEERPALLVVIEDISARKEAEDLFRMVTEHSKVGIFIEQDKRFQFVNPEFASYVDMRMEELKHKDPLDLVHPEDRETVRSNSIAMLKGQRKAPTAFRAITGKGRLHWMLQSVVPVRFRGRRAVLGSLVDIEEQKRSEELLQKMHSELEQLVSSISSLIVCITPEDVITRANDAAAELLGLSKKELLGSRIGECNVRWDVQRVLEGLERCRKTRAIVRLDDLRFVRPNGKEGLMGLTLHPAPAAEGGSIIILGADITEKKAMETQLMQALKLESIGQLAAGIAHEINTPIQYVGDNLHFLDSAFSDLTGLLEKYQDLASAVSSLQSGQIPHEVSAALEGVERAHSQVDLAFLKGEIPPAIKQALEGVERVAKIVASMKMLSHPGLKERSPFDIKEAIESAVTVCRNEWKYVAELSTVFDPELKVINGFPGEFNQVILNLLVNAAHAIGSVVKQGEKGRITVTTKKDGEWAEISVADTGCGIPENIRTRIFDPFFTTKDVGKGTGQGLAIAHSVITEKHGGRIWFESETGKGTTFRIRIPINPPEKGS